MNGALRAALFCAALMAGLAAAAEPQPPATSAPAAAPPATLEIGGRDVTTFRATIFGYKPADRADAARLRLLRAYAKNPNLTLIARHVADGSQVLADGTIMFIVVPGDVNELSGETPEQEAGRAIEVLRHVIEERAERGDPVALGRSIGIAAIATLVAILLWRLVFALDRRLGIAFSRRVAQRASAVTVSGVSLLDTAFLLRVARKAVHSLAWILAAVIGYLWLNAVLESLPFTRPWGDKLTRILLGILVAAARGTLDALPGLLFVVVIVVVARLATQVVTYFLDQLTERDTRVAWLDRHTAKPTRILATLAIWVLAIAMAYPYFPGSDSRAFQGLSVLVGVMVSIGASSIVGQAAAGLILMYTRTFTVGQYVRIQDVEGTVMELGIFATRIRTGMGDEAMLPNNVVLANLSRNYSSIASSGFVVHVTMTIGYDTPWRQVHAMMREAVKRTPGISQDPPPRIFQTALSDFYVEYRLAALCTESEALSRMEATSRLHANLLDVFNEHGVQIMSPHYMADPESAKVVPPAKKAPAPALPDEA